MSVASGSSVHTQLSEYKRGKSADTVCVVSQASESSEKGYLHSILNSSDTFLTNVCCHETVQLDEMKMNVNWMMTVDIKECYCSWK